MNCLRLPATVLLVLTLLIRFTNPAIAQSAALENVTAIINTMNISANGELTVSFKLPFSASPIGRTEYIQVYMPNFVNIQPPHSVSGPYTGTPTYTIAPGFVKVTGITVVPGAEISINGIQALTPAFDSYWPITVYVTTDATLNTIKHQGSTDVTISRNRVSISALIETIQSSISIAGYTSPETYVTFTKNQAVAGTDVSGMNGYFGKIFNGLSPGTHEYTFFGTDQYYRTTSPITVGLYAPASSQVSITDQILSPTLSIDKSSYTDGESIQVSGSAVPNAMITIFTQAPLRIYTAIANNQGEWNYTITNTAEYVVGDYSIYALAQSPAGFTSLNSLSLGFTIASTVPAGTPCGDITKGDLNCDSSIDLTDFSILMYYWGTANAIADINTDGQVNLTDFSILMYWWGT